MNASSEHTSPNVSSGPWPSLPWEEWKDTAKTLHLWMQIVGKVRTVQSPWTNHSWHVPLYLTSRGMTTSPIPHGHRTFDLAFDFFSHELRITTSEGDLSSIELRPRSVANFHDELMGKLDELGYPVEIYPIPAELPDPVIPYPEDDTHASYDPQYAERFWRVILSADRVFKRFRAEFVGKASPVHFFWGSFDLAVTRFSGRPAPAHPGGVPNFPDWIAREAYSHEVSSAGFWPGNDANPQPIFYCYAYPAPEGFAAAPVEPAEAYYDEGLYEFVLPYEQMRRLDDPEAALMRFLETTYAAAADAAMWDRDDIERRGGPPDFGFDWGGNE